jgi:hypothetical protein
VYVGHAAIALALKAREPRLALVPLTMACFGPDWLEVALMIPKARAGMAVYTHSLVAVLLGAAVAGAAYAAFRRPGARLIALAWLLHWPADLLTGRKPMFLGEPLVGLDLYGLPLADFLLESTLVAIGCALYARRLAPRGVQRRVVVMLGTALILLQGAADVALAVMRKAEWTPSLARSARQTQVGVPPA